MCLISEILEDTHTGNVAYFGGVNFSRRYARLQRSDFIFIFPFSQLVRFRQNHARLLPDRDLFLQCCNFPRQRSILLNGRMGQFCNRQPTGRWGIIAISGVGSQRIV